jgi:type IV secretion system protein VirB11
MNNNTSKILRHEESEKRKITQLTISLGPIALMFQEDDITDIMVNPDGKIWVERIGVGREQSKHRITSNVAESIIKLVATNTGQVVGPTNPLISAELPGSGYRFEGCLPPITTAPTICIRKATSQLITLDEMVLNKTINLTIKKVIVDAIRDYKNILVIGGTGSGKTTLILAILNEIAKICKDDRVIILEDTRELVCDAENQTAMKTSDDVDMTMLLKSTMRQNPDRIIVGEVRGAEALALLKAWNTGHPGGVSTVHANDCKSSLYRLEQLVLEAILYPQPELIGEAIDLVISIKKLNKNQRKILEIIEVTGYRDKKYLTKEIKIV